jgi:hypothetical protein
MTITIRVAQTAGVTFNSQANSFPGFIRPRARGHRRSVHRVLVRARPRAQSIPANYAGGTVYAQYNVEPVRPGSDLGRHLVRHEYLGWH